jgi:predicted ATPase/class 3 adenylate cyclase
MFCDMVGSSALSTRLDPEEQGEVIAAFHACCANEIKALGGMVAQYLGDGVLAYFGYPTADENDAERAILAGLAILRAAGTLTITADVRVQIRIAIGSGVVVVGDLMRERVTQENAAIGDTTNLVARLQAIAEPNSLVISPVTHRLVGALFDYRDLGQHALKGFPEPVHVRQVLGPSKVESRFEAQHQAGASPLLGRNEELELLLRRWEEARLGGGRVVVLTGEPGIGKSRIARALRDRITSDPHTPLSAYCSPHHQNSALYPHVIQLTRAAGIERDDSADVKLDKLRSLLAQSSGKLDQDMPLFAALLSIPAEDRYPLPEMTPQRRKEQTLAALLDQLKRLASRQPVLVVYEDLHWIDPTSLELLSLAVERIGEQRILLLATARPEFTPPWPGHSHVSTLSLNRFGRSECETLISGITKGKALPLEVHDQIVSRTDGVPLFIEELTKTVLESGLLRDTGDHYELTGPLPPLAIPSTLHASLLARLDRLAAVKDVAQIAAVSGREFSYPLIAAAAVIPERDLNAALAQLVAAGLMHQRGVPPDATYQFKHALVQDAAYASLVRSRRQQLHGAIARALEEKLPDLVETEPETLAHHLTEAGLTESALSYWLKAGQRATARWAYTEAVSHLERGLALLNALRESANRDRRELDLLVALRAPMTAVTGFALNPDFEARTDRATALAEKLADVRHLYTSLHAQFTYCQATCKIGKLREIAEQCHELAVRVGDRDMQFGAHQLMGRSALERGEFAAARNEYEQAVAKYDPERDRSIPSPTAQIATCSSMLTWALWISGYPARAANMQKQALRYAADLNHVFTNFWVHWAAGVQLEQLFGNTAAVLVHADVLDALLLEHGVKTWWMSGGWSDGIATFYRGWAIASDGDAGGIALMQRGLAILEAKNIACYQPYYRSLLAQIQACAGEPHPALALCRDAQARAQQTEERVWLAELHRIEGEVRCAAGDSLTKVEDCFRQALDISRRQGARMFELRAATALAQLWRDQQRGVEARDLLAPVYAWFTEGFNTVDLKVAQALLAELSA